MKDTGGAGNEEIVLKSAQRKFPSDWLTDGLFLLYAGLGNQGSFDLWILPDPGSRGKYVR